MRSAQLCDGRSWRTYSEEEVASSQLCLGPLRTDRWAAGNLTPHKASTLWIVGNFQFEGQLRADVHSLTLCLVRLISWPSLGYKASYTLSQSSSWRKGRFQLTCAPIEEAPRRNPRLLLVTPDMMDDVRQTGCWRRRIIRSVPGGGITQHKAPLERI